MFQNPFSPIFGGRPDFFFGRKAILRRFDAAMVDYGSEDRALFITGTRGSGKTALLEQLSRHAASAGKQVIDLGPEHTVETLIRSLVRHSEETKTLSPGLGINVLGTGASANAGSLAKTIHYGREDIQLVLLDACKKTKHGLFITIDEIQKVPIEDVSAICNAFQMASRKGFDALLAVAGLPYSHEQIIQHEGCTYLRRAAHEELGLFTWEEADEAFVEAFRSIKGLSLADDCLPRLNEASFGHPYLMQLLGYKLVGIVNEDNGGNAKHVVQLGEVERSIPLARSLYELRALSPIIRELPELSLKYLTAMSRVLSDERRARTSEIAQSLGMRASQLSRTRERLIQTGLVASSGHGELVFCIPYLADYLKSSDRPNSNLQTVLERRV